MAAQAPQDRPVDFQDIGKQEMKAQYTSERLSLRRNAFQRQVCNGKGTKGEAFGLQTISSVKRS